MGDDFAYDMATDDFERVDNFMNYFNAHPGNENIKLIYSTPSRYLKALNDQKDISWPVKYDDIFPYADVIGNYWTGYFTSR